jgi:hypothetical protein
MSILTIFKGEDLESFYYRVMDELDAIYHTHPTALKYTTYEDIKGSPPSGYDEIAKESLQKFDGNGHTPLGKLIL